ncbi:histidine kinase [Georgenia halophila]|uniref:histidine kinase n=1 Tax=Georgenia halophila TaxID=620889 RepID=A0ABP8L0V8_9MICO
METIGRLLARLRDPASYQRVDTVVAAVALVFLGIPGVVVAVGFSQGGMALGLVTAAVAGLCALVQSVAMAWRRTRPVHSAVIVYAAALVHFCVGAFTLPTDVLVLVALYSVTVHTEPHQRWARRAGLAGALLGALMMGVLLAGGPVTAVRDASLLAGGFLTVAAMVFATWAIALARRGRVERLESLEDRARRLEIEQDQQIRLATAAERTRIAREMHDVVAHSLSVVIAQADGGRYAARTDPAAAERTLSTISTMGRDALADMRRILGVLRADPGGEGVAPTSPEPQLDGADLETLVAQVRDAGLAVSLVRTGEARPLPPGVGVGAYRIVQEALTNVLKHGGPGARVTVLQQWLPDRLVMQVEDDGRGAAASSDGQGQGIMGMRERAELFGGNLTAGPRAGGGFRVRAEIPLPGGGGTSAVEWQQAPDDHMPGSPGHPAGPTPVNEA